MIGSDVAHGTVEEFLFWAGVIALVPLGALIAKRWGSLTQRKRVAVTVLFIGFLLGWLGIRLGMDWVEAIGMIVVFLGWFLGIGEETRQWVEEGDDRFDASSLYRMSKYYLAIALFMMSLLAAIFLLKFLRVI